MTDWSKPSEVTDLDIAFGANALDFMPPREEAEEALEALPDRGRKWIDFQGSWFYSGISPDAVIDLKDGIDGNLAFRHLRVIQGSWAPKHEHKVAAVAYLCSLWFNDVRDYKQKRSTP